MILQLNKFQQHMLNNLLHLNHYIFLLDMFYNLKILLMNIFLIHK